MLDFVFEQLSARVERVKETAVTTRAAPTEEAIHALRVSIRRLTEAVRSLEEWVKPKPAGKLRDRLRPVMKAAGEARNLDIARELLPSVAEVLAPLRTEAAHRLIEELLLLDIEKLHPPCEPDPDVPVPRLLAAPILADLIPKYWEAGDNATDLHQFRLATKHLRYTIELLAPVYGRGAQTKLNVLKEIQSHLGKFHDCQAARELELIKTDPQLDELLANRQHAQREKFQKTWDAVHSQRDAWVRYFCGSGKLKKNTMKVIVAIKQVPARASRLRPDASGRWIDTSDLTTEINEPDAYALEEALQWKEKHSGEVVVLCAGPANATQTIRDALAKGADRALHIEVDDLAAYDSLSLARILADAARDENPDLILTGLQSDDLGYGQTGVILAELLGLPHATIIMQTEKTAAGIRVKRELEDGWFQHVELPLPALLTIQSGINKLRYSTLMGIKKARSKEIKPVKASAASAASVQLERVYAPQRSKQTRLLEGDARKQAAQLVEVLRHEVRAI